MSTITRTFVSRESPGVRRAGAGGRPCQGLYHHREGEQPKTALIATHYQIDFAEHYLADYMAERGIGFLGWNTRYRGYEWLFQLDEAVVDIGVGVRWLKEVAGVEKVVILGNSGGCSLMSAYQSEAVQHCIRPARDMPSAAGLDGLIQGDAFISLAAHPGRPDVLTSWMDPAVLDEHDPTLIDPALDMYNPDNGPGYSDSFVARYRQAQVERNHRITRWARAELDRVTERGYYDRHFSVTRTWADPRMMDPEIDPSSRPARRCYRGDPRQANNGDRGIGAESTLRNWLHMWSLEDSQCRADEHLKKVTTPALVINADADTGVFPSDAKKIFDAIASTDKQFVSLPGDHYFQEMPGARDKVADTVAAWIGEKL